MTSVVFGNNTSNRDRLDISVRGGVDVDQSYDTGGYSGLVRYCHTFDGSSANLYVNGSLVSTGNENANWDGVSQGLYWGHNGGGNKQLSGVIDYPIVYDKSLSLSEVEDDYNSQPWS